MPPTGRSPSSSQAFEALTSQVVAEAEAIKKAAVALAVIDVSAGLATLAEEQAYCRPQVDQSRMFAIDGGRHPVVEQALRRQAGAAFVANDCDLSPHGGRGRWRHLAADRPQHGR